jgi:hypothetical protein
VENFWPGAFKGSASAFICSGYQQSRGGYSGECALWTAVEIEGLNSEIFDWGMFHVEHFWYLDGRWTCVVVVEAIVPRGTIWFVWRVGGEVFGLA